MKNGFEVHIARKLNVEQEGELLLGDRVTYSKTIYRFNGLTRKTEHHEPVSIASDFYIALESFFFPIRQEKHLVTWLYDIEDTNTRLLVTFDTEKKEYVEAHGVVEMTVQEYRKFQIPNLLAGI